MYSYIDSILSYKNRKYESENKKVDKNQTKIYLDSYIVFVYDEYFESNSFLFELGKFDIRKVNMKNLTIMKKKMN